MGADGYRIVGCDGVSYLLHRLVCTTWHSQPPTPGHRVSHKDWDASNNTPANLEWVTLSESNQDSRNNNPNLKSNAGSLSKPVRGRKLGTNGEWTHFESCAAAARELGPGFARSGIIMVLNGRRAQAGGWTFELTQQFEAIEGEQWRSVVLDGVKSGAQVSNRGRFRSTTGLVGFGSERERGGHHTVGIHGKSHLLHRLVCTVWHGPPPTPEHTDVTHKDLDPSNNAPANLEWSTKVQKQKHLRDNNPNRKSSAGARSKPVRGRKQGTEDEWRHFKSCSAAARELGPGFDRSAIQRVANGIRTHAGGWTFEDTQQCEDIAGEVWKDVVLPSGASTQISEV